MSALFAIFTRLRHSLGYNLFCLCRVFSVTNEPSTSLPTFKPRNLRLPLDLDHPLRPFRSLRRRRPVYRWPLGVGTHLNQPLSANRLLFFLVIPLFPPQLLTVAPFGRPFWMGSLHSEILDAQTTNSSLIVTNFSHPYGWPCCEDFD